MAAVPLGEDFSLSPYGIREPLGSPWAGSIDVAVVPLWPRTNRETDSATAAAITISF
ncbi:MAG: hypothetical protein ACLR06_06100 [Christensenellaceae bacterium]